MNESLSCTYTIMKLLSYGRHIHPTVEIPVFETAPIFLSLMSQRRNFS